MRINPSAIPSLGFTPDEEKSLSGVILTKDKDLLAKVDSDFGRFPCNINQVWPLIVRSHLKKVKELALLIHLKDTGLWARPTSSHPIDPPSNLQKAIL